jgi:hypothetical protein
VLLGRSGPDEDGWSMNACCRRGVHRVRTGCRRGSPNDRDWDVGPPYDAFGDAP